MGTYRTFTIKVIAVGADGKKIPAHCKDKKYFLSSMGEAIGRATEGMRVIKDRIISESEAVVFCTSRK